MTAEDEIRITHGKICSNTRFFKFLAVEKKKRIRMHFFSIRFFFREKLYFEKHRF